MGNGFKYEEAIETIVHQNYICFLISKDFFVMHAYRRNIASDKLDRAHMLYNWYQANWWFQRSRTIVEFTI